MSCLQRRRRSRAKARTSHQIPVDGRLPGRGGSAAGSLGVALAVALMASACGGSSHASCKGCGGRGVQAHVVREVDALLADIPQDGDTLGSPSAPVTLQYFGDLECPFCQKFTLGVLPAIVTRWVRPGKLRIEYRSLETATREPEMFKAQQVAALAAGPQHKMWSYLELFYHEQGSEGTRYATEEYLRGLARQIPGLKLAEWNKDRADPVFNQELNRDAELAGLENLTGTPAFMIGHTGGAARRLQIPSLTDSTGWDAAIEQQLRG